MNIGLMGFEFKSPNKGCEALVYSFLSILKDNLKKDFIVYNFTGTELGVIPVYFDNIKFINISPRIRDFKAKYIRILTKCDYVFDVTMGDSFSDIYSKDYYNSLIKHKRIAELFCKKYVLLPQTIGPFENAESATKAEKVLHKAYKIYTRDEISKKLLEEKFKINNSILATDMAFILPYDKELYKFSSKKKLGINISGLLYKGGFHSENQFGLSLDYKELINRLLAELTKRFEVHIIPHVVDLSENSYDDDYKICELMHKDYPDTTLAPAFETPIEAKSYICNMDIFIGARMHATIAAFSSNVITIPISYSRKFEGLYGSLNYPFVVNARSESTDSAFKLILNYINCADELSKSQGASMYEINRKIQSFEKSILELMEEK
ncbi:MAG: polysaccharide pyruvyl transferase family protein [Lachnospiraceae bacterium]|nr:polysaccharide pyruvyl transferase family protein [Lachnospiraceae bacterium]